MSAFSISMMNKRYYLRHEVGFCIVDEQITFLDFRDVDETGFRAHAYTALPIDKSYRLHQALLGKGAPCWPGNDQLLTPSEEADEAFEEILECGLVTDDPSLGRRGLPFQSPMPGTSLSDSDAFPGQTAVMSHAASYFMAARTAIRLMPPDVEDGETFRKISTGLVERLRRRKALAGQSGRPFDRERAGRLALIARELRPWFDEKPDCTTDALIVIEFFARHGLYPDWVFGVQANPLQAHCWVQQDDVVINDAVDVVSQFTPIMSV